MLRRSSRGSIQLALFVLVLAGRSFGQVCVSSPAPLNTNAYTDSGADTNVRIATDKQGVWIATWTSTDSLGGTIGTDQDILYARSFDNGQTWSAPAPLNSNAATDTGSDHWSRISTDGAGHWVCIWCSTDSLGGTIGTDWDILVSRSTDNGATWSAPAPLNTDAATDPVTPYPQNDLWPDMATDGNGVWIASWSSILSLGASWSTQTRVARSTDNGLTWSTPVALRTTSVYDELFSAVTTDRQGNWVVVWRSPDTLGGTIGSDLDILYSRSTDGGLTWSPAAALNTNAATDTGADRDPDVLADSSGVFIAVWRSSDSLGGTKGTDDDIVFARSTDAGATWSAPQALTARMKTDSGGDAYPRLATDGAGNWLVAFESSDTLGGLKTAGSDILYARSQDGGLTWPAEGIVNLTAPTESQYDGIAYPMTDGQGHWIIGWLSYETLGGTIGGEGDILYAQVSCVEPTPAPNAARDWGAYE